MNSLVNHLWQSTLFAAAAALLALTLRRNRAQTRYWIWLAASAKFFVPFALLTSLGSLFEWPAAPMVAPPVVSTARQFSQAFAPVPYSTAPAPTVFAIANLAVSAWILGSAFVLLRWILQWRRAHTAMRHARALPIDAPIPVLSSSSLIEP